MCRPTGPPEGVLADAMHGTFSGSVTVALSSTTVADTRAALLPASGRPALQGFVAAGRVEDEAGGRAVHGPSAVDAGRRADAARQLPCATMMSFASAGELAVQGSMRHAPFSCPTVLLSYHLLSPLKARCNGVSTWQLSCVRCDAGSNCVTHMVAPCAGHTTDVLLAVWADQQAAQGRGHTVIQWGNWTEGKPCGADTMSCMPSRSSQVLSAVSLPLTKCKHRHECV